MNDESDEFLKSLPFVTTGVAYGTEYIGILNIKGKSLTSIYIFDLINNNELLLKLIELGEVWWWECNRNIPISVFMNEKILEFEFCKKFFPSKEFNILTGPVVSVSNIPAKRIKRNTTILKRR